MGLLNKEQVEQFHNEGYLVVKNFLSDDDVTSLKTAIETIIDEFQPDQHKSVFTTSDSPKQARDVYFMESGDKIRYFFEEGALNDKGELVVEKHRSLNKIGHALHWLNPDFKRVSFSAQVKETIKDIGFNDPAIAQSMYIFKQPGIGGEVSPHQDSTFLHTKPMKIVGLWFALEDVTLENGCLWFIPGSHKQGISRRFVRNPDKESSNLTIYTGSNPDYDNSAFIPGPVSKGSMVLIHGEIVHKSDRNLSPHSRQIYTFHVIERNSEYSSDNWLQPTEELPFPGIFDN